MLTFAIILALATPAPSPKRTPDPLTVNGFFRSYLFTRQNASNNPGARFDYSQGAKYSSAGVNQLGWEQAIDLHAEYAFPHGWYIGGSYLYGDPFAGPCSTALTHVKGNACVSQRPPNTNPDDTVPDFILSTFYEAYLGYRTGDFNAKLGDQLFDSPWAGLADTRIKPESYQGGDFVYAPHGWTFELADMLQFQPRTSSTFISSTLLTSFPAGNKGLPPNMYYAGGGNITTPGFLYGRVGYAAQSKRYSINGYLWSVSDIVNMYWGDAQYTFSENRWKPFLALQGGLEYNTGRSVIGKIDSSLFGAQIGAHATNDIVVALGYDALPWHYDDVTLPSGFSCANSSYQIKIPAQQSPPKPGNTLAYFLPLSTGQCFTNPNGLTTIAYGGWASPFTDNYANAPVFTTAISESVADRRAPGTSWRITATYDTPNKRVNFIVGNSWFDYSNALVAQTTSEFNLDGTYRFWPVPKSGPYHGLRFRYRYADRRYSNTAVVGGLPLFKYNRAMLEYDF